METETELALLVDVVCAGSQVPDLLSRRSSVERGRWNNGELGGLSLKAAWRERTYAMDAMQTDGHDVRTPIRRR